MEEGGECEGIMAPNFQTWWKLWIHRSKKLNKSKAKEMWRILCQGIHNQMLKIMEKEKVLKAHPKRHVTLRENKNDVKFLMANNER